MAAEREVTRRETIEACARACDEEAAICGRQKESTHSRDRQRLVHEGGQCIAKTLAHRIRKLVEDEASAGKETGR
jgi:hypothetical protein